MKLLAGAWVRFAFFFLLTVFLAGGAVGDWDPGDAFKMHYPQEPDPVGWDVDCQNYMLGDDWLCTESGPVTGIHFWVSWYQDVEGTVADVQLRIYDNFAGPPYSQPSNLLWEANSSKGECALAYRFYGSDAQGFLEPPTGVSLPDHFNYYQINCTDFLSPWEQVAGEMYWLVVTITTTGGGVVGWKSTLTPYEDAAVYWDGISWQMLMDPIYATSLDLAFVISGGIAAGPDKIDWGALKGPNTAVTTLGVPTESITGVVYVAGVTDPAGQGAGISAELGYGPYGSFPTNNPAWSWVPAGYAGDDLTNDLYAATLTVNTIGQFSYAYRFSIDGGANWLYGDRADAGTPPGGSADGYNPAFAGDLYVEPPESCAKYSQLPDCRYGVDMPTWGMWDPQGGGIDTMYLVADDWWCDGRPITGLRWWGSYLGWEIEEPPLTKADGRPVGFKLTWYTDVPTNAALGIEYSRPGVEITNTIVALAPYDWPEPPQAGQVVESYYCIVTNKLTMPGYEHEYLYEAVLETPWLEKEGTVYWLSIQALYDITEPPESGTPKWGWKTSDELDTIDDAVVWDTTGMPHAEIPWQEMNWPRYPLPRLWEQSHGYNRFIMPPPTNPSVNMAFELWTDVCPGRAKKWVQEPDMVFGTDMWCWRKEEGPPGVIRADDFVSDGRLITDIHWWGSYSNWQWWVPGCATNPVSPPKGLNRPKWFLLSWHLDDGACRPLNPPLRDIWVSITNCHEVYYGTVTQEWVNPEILHYEHEYQYYVDLLEVDSWWEEIAGEHYWLNIQAVFDAEFFPGMDENQHMGWGWKVARGFWETNSPCPSVESGDGGVTWVEGVMPPPPYPRSDEVWYDLAFELTTTEPSTNYAGPIVITNIATWTTNAYRVKSVGHSGAGVQYLQMRTNLLTGGWTSVSTNPTPKHAPLRNTWTRGWGHSNEFYRVLEK
ncbi:MAG: hypothetical protein JW951_07705 [Lentisphaerae bacterium]|nr:hypothetical protein [Lentisphaerota bacterium]